ncbi:MAG: hypothetical protein K6E13_00090 [Lachnospiraceae bacterium]|nr:hypothetical protein [Lachnospiraceae bacterium]
MKSLKKFLVTVIVLAIIVGGIGVAIKLYRVHKVNTTSVEGVAVEMLNNAEWLAYQTTSYSTGLVSSDNRQAVYYSSDKTITGINVNVGDTVNAGDVLLTYDTAKSDLEVEVKEIDIQQVANDIILEQRTLEKLKVTVPVEETEEEEEEEEEEEVDVEAETMINTPIKDGDAYNYINKKAEAYEGKGTSEKPYRFLCTEDCYVYGSYLNWLIEKGKVAVFEVYEGNDLERADIISSWKADGNKMTESYSDDAFYNVITKDEVVFNTVEDIEDETEEEEEEETDTEEETYTAEELKEAIEESEANIKELDLKKRKLELELQKLKASLDESEVVAKVNGTVTKVASLENTDSLTNSDVVVEVCASTGKYLTGNISELQLGTLNVGDEITATSWSNNNTYTATITEISDIPVSESDYYSYGSNPNVSYYPFTAYIETGDELESGDALDLSISSTSEDVASIILEKSYVRKENGHYYVYKADENDKLVKQYVTTGKTYEGYYIEIKDGLSEDDFIVFPYGTEVKEGVTVQHDEIIDEDEEDLDEDYDDYSDDYSDDEIIEYVDDGSDDTVEDEEFDYDE